jgi:hypothetical protein
MASLQSLAGLVCAPRRGHLLHFTLVAESGLGWRSGCHHCLQHQERSNHCHQVLILDIAMYQTHLHKRCTWVWGGLKSPPLSSKLSLELGAPRAGLQPCPSGKYTGSSHSWHSGDGGKVNHRNFRRRRLLLLPVSSIVVDISYYSAVFIFVFTTSSCVSIFSPKLLSPFH